MKLKVFCDRLTQFLNNHGRTKDVFTSKNGIEILSDFFFILNMDVPISLVKKEKSDD